jgi:hypothetical protein
VSHESPIAPPTASAGRGSRALVIASRVLHRIAAPHVLVPIVGVTMLAVFAAHARAYFFLLDDFVIVGEASARAVSRIFREPVVNFYRPAMYVWTKLEFALFGWSHPGAYAALSLVLHSVCSVLTGALVLVLGEDRKTAVIAAALFLISPWATEPYLWVSGGFDLIATMGILAALTLGLAFWQSTGTLRTMSALAAGGCAAVLGLLAKEIGVLAPVMLVASIAAVHGLRGFRRPRAIVYAMSLLALTAVYLTYREQRLPGLGGGYGSLQSLLQKSSLAVSAFSYLRALITFPFPDHVRLLGMSLVDAAGMLFGSTTVFVVWHAFRARWRLALLGAIGIVAAIAPVIWVTLIKGSSSGNRFLYFAGTWFAMLLALGLRRLETRAVSDRARLVHALATIIIVGTALGSVVHQARIWRRASSLSHAAIEQAEGLAGGSQGIFIENLPMLFADGPYVMNELAFLYYFKGTNYPPVRARSMGLKFDRGDAVFAFWAGNSGEWRAAANEKNVKLQLPVWMPDPLPQALLETPPAGAHVTQPFKIRGWAVDASSRVGPGVDVVQVYAYPGSTLQGPPVFLGTARYGDARSDVAGSFGGPQFTKSGFYLEARGLTSGAYILAIFPHNVIEQRFSDPTTIPITVR